MLHLNRYSSSSFKKIILQLPADNLLQALKERQDIIDKLELDEALIDLLVESFVKIATRSAYQLADLGSLLEPFILKLQNATLVQLLNLLEKINASQLQQEVSSAFNLAIVACCTTAIADTNDLSVVLPLLPPERQLDLCELILSGHWHMPSDTTENTNIELIQKSQHRFNEESCVALISYLSGRSLMYLFALISCTMTIFNKKENVITLIADGFIGLSSRCNSIILENCQRDKRQLLLQSLFSKEMLLEEHMRDAELNAYKSLIKWYANEFSKVMHHFMKVPDLLQLLTAIKQCADPAFTLERKRIVVKCLVENCHALIESTDELSAVLEFLHEDDRYGLMKQQEVYWQEAIQVSRDMQLALAGGSTPASPSFFKREPQQEEPVKEPNSEQKRQKLG